MTPSEVLRQFADRLDGHRPSMLQLAVGSGDFNKGAVRALEWAAEEARREAALLQNDVK